MSTIERRSGVDNRSFEEQQRVGERRAGIERRARPSEAAEDMPSLEQLSAFGRRLKRAMRDPNGRNFFGQATGEYQFSIFPDVIRLVDWIDHMTKSAEEAPAVKPTLRKAMLVGALRQR